MYKVEECSSDLMIIAGVTRQSQQQDSAEGDLYVFYI